MRNNEKGQAILLIILALGVFLLGAMGLAIDGAQMYAHREMAQSAADAAAQAGIFSIFAKTQTTTGAAHTCSTTDTDVACVYARNNGFGGSADDSVVITYPASPYNGVTGSPNYTYAFEQVSITRTLHTSFMRFLGTSTSTVKAIGGAGIVQSFSPVPILVLDPTGSPSFSLSGTPSISICGGAQRSIQVNSSAAGAVNVGGSATLDLSKAGPADPGNCTTGTGGDFGVFGSTNAFPSWLTPLGTTEHYVHPAAPIGDPLKTVAAPAKPAAGVPTTSGFGTNAGELDCPVTASKGCTIYNPGYYSGGIQVKNTTGIFQPGIYYLDGTNAISNAANGDIIMCSTTCVADTSGCCSNNGVMMYITAASGQVSVGANSSATMLGSSASSSYKGILFFVDRSAADKSPVLGGGGNISLTGTVYMPTQTLSFNGHSGNTTKLKGEIIVNDLGLGGSSGITMQLDPNYLLSIDQVALVR